MTSAVDPAALNASSVSVAADKAAADKAAADQAAADQAAADQAAAESSAAEQSAATADGWYDDRGWVSPDTAARALAAGIGRGENVPGYLRCGTICGESPTSGEIQQQWMEDQGLLNPDGSLTNDPCTSGYLYGGTCYPGYDAAAEACGGYLIRHTCYPSSEAAAAAGEGE